MKLAKLVNQYAELEEKIMDELAELPNFAGECHCDSEEGTFDTIHRGDFDEIFTYCLSCGGVVV